MSDAGRGAADAAGMTDDDGGGASIRQRIHYTTAPPAIKKLNKDEVGMRYKVGDDKLTTITITKDGSYFADEPALSADAQQAYGTLTAVIQEVADYDVLTAGARKGGAGGDPIIPIINKYVDQEAESNPAEWSMWDRERHIINHYLIRDLSNDHFGIVDPIMQDPYVEDMLVVTWYNPVPIAHSKYSNPTLLTTNIKFPDEKSLSRFISRQAQMNGAPPPTDFRPTCTFPTRQKYRFTGTIDRITPDSATLSIRKPVVKKINIHTLLNSGMLSPALAAYLWVMVDMKQFGIVVGAPGTGKTSMINALLTMGDPSWHYFLIEDTLELDVLHQNVTRHQTTTTALEKREEAGQGQMGIFDMCKLSLRFRPDFVVVGEVLGDEINEVIAVAASGSGCMTTFHATSPDHAFTKMQNAPFNVPKAQTGQVNFMMFLKQQQLGSRRQRVVSQLTECRLLTKAEAIRIQRSEDFDPLRPKVINMGIFTFDVRHSKIMPETAVEVVEKSNLLKQMSVVLDRQDPVEDMEIRMAILEDIKADEKCEGNPQRVFQKIMEYYRIR